uniref:Uncharacterized protein n=1 Tax=Oryza nivara TaxID=4536 RepID=A0A0E0IQ19_ORYNI
MTTPNGSSSHDGRGQPRRMETVGKDVDRCGFLSLLLRGTLSMVMEGATNEASIGSDVMVSHHAPCRSVCSRRITGSGVHKLAAVRTGILQLVVAGFGRPDGVSGGNARRP